MELDPGYAAAGRNRARPASAAATTLQPDFIAFAEKTPFSAPASRNVASAVLLLSVRTRRVRALLRLAAVTTWLAVAIASGTNRWPLGLIWVATVLVTLAHAYRGAVIRFGRRYLHLGDPLLTWALPEYTAEPRVNFPGLFDLAGCLFGGLLTGLLLPSWSAVHLYPSSSRIDPSYVGAAYVLAAVVLIGGAHIVASHSGWMQVGVRDRSGYLARWLTVCTLATVVVYFSLWPGTKPATDRRLLFLIDIAAALATMFTCWYGRRSAATGVSYARNLVDETRRGVRSVDAFEVHSLLGSAVELLHQFGETPIPSLVTALEAHITLIKETQLRLESDQERTVRSLEDLVAAWKGHDVSRQTWSIVTNIESQLLRRKDAALVQITTENLLSNAARADATGFTISLSVRDDPTSILGETMEIEATCTCGRRFAPPAEGASSGLVKLAALVASYNGTTNFDDYGDGSHTFVVSWPTLGILPSAESDRPMETTRGLVEPD